MSLNTINFNLLKEFLGTLDPNDYLVLRRSSEGKDYKVKVSSLIAGGSGGIPTYDPARDPDYTEGEVVEFNLKLWLWINETDGNSVPAEGADWTEISRSEAGGIPAYAPGVYDGDNIAVTRDGFIWTLKAAQPRPYTATASFNAAHWDQFPLMAVTDDIVNTAFAKNRPVGAYDLRTHYANKSSGTFTEVTPQNWTFPSSRLSVQKLRTTGLTAVVVNLTNPDEPVQADDGLKHCVFLIDKDIAGDFTVTFNAPGGTRIYTPQDRDGVASKAFVFSGATNSKWILDIYYGPAGAVGQGYHISVNEDSRSAVAEDKRINEAPFWINDDLTPYVILLPFDFKIDVITPKAPLTLSVKLSDGTTDYTLGDTITSGDYITITPSDNGTCLIQGTMI